MLSVPSATRLRFQWSGSAAVSFAAAPGLVSGTGSSPVGGAVDSDEAFGEGSAFSRRSSALGVMTRREHNITSDKNNDTDFFIRFSSIQFRCHTWEVRVTE